MSEASGDGSAAAVSDGGSGSGSGSSSGGSLADVQRQLAALESRYAALVAKHDDTENDLAFQRKRVESAVSKVTLEKDEEIAQSAHSTDTATLTQHTHIRQCRHRVGEAGKKTTAGGWDVSRRAHWTFGVTVCCLPVAAVRRLKQAFAEVSEKRKAAFTQMKESAAQHDQPHHLRCERCRALCHCARTAALTLFCLVAVRSQAVGAGGCGRSELRLHAGAVGVRTVGGSQSVGVDAAFAE